MKLARFAKSLGYLALGAGAALALVLFFRTPSLERDWKTEYAVLPEAEVDGDLVALRNIRNFNYDPDGSIAAANYYDADYDLTKLASVWYGISHFASYGLAHTFLSFGFEDGRFLVVSIEARQEVGQDYGPIKGLLRNYELVYIVADERDVVGLRTHIRSQRALLYQLTLAKPKAEALLRSLLSSVEEQRRNPSFYNTVTDNCTTNILKYAEHVSLWQRWFDYRVVLPGYSDELAFDLGVIATDGGLEQARQVAYLDPSRTTLDDPDFSLKIRGMAQVPD